MLRWSFWCGSINWYTIRLGSFFDIKGIFEIYIGRGRPDVVCHLTVVSRLRGETLRFLTSHLLFFSDKSLPSNSLLVSLLWYWYQFIYKWETLWSWKTHCNKTSIYGINRPFQREKVDPKYQGCACLLVKVRGVNLIANVSIFRGVRTPCMWIREQHAVFC